MVWLHGGLWGAYRQWQAESAQVRKRERGSAPDRRRGNAELMRPKSTLFPVSVKGRE
jgi:hypothetical protein